jgi:hypothetical protein
LTLRDADRPSLQDGILKRDGHGDATFSYGDAFLSHEADFAYSNEPTGWLGRLFGGHGHDMTGVHGSHALLAGYRMVSRGAG